MKKLILILLAAGTFASCGDKKKTEETTATKTEDKPAAKAHKNEKVDVNVTAKIPYFDASGDLTINNVTMDFWPEKSEMLPDPKEKGRQFIRVEFTVTGTTKKPYYLSSTGFKIKGSDGKEEMITFFINDGNSKDTQKANEEVKKGQSVTYADYFEVDGKQTPDDLTLLVDGEKDKSVVIPIKFKK